MPSRRRTGGPPSVASTNSDDPGEAYKLKRQRNNDAVKKTRAKSRETATERKRNVEKLRNENLQLEATIEEMKKNVKTLKDLLLGKVADEDKGRMIQKILEEQSDDDSS